MPPKIFAGGGGGGGGGWAPGKPKPIMPSTPLKSVAGIREIRLKLYDAGISPGELQSVILPNLAKAKYSPSCSTSWPWKPCARVTSRRAIWLWHAAQASWTP
jgi:hypothetical protein